MTRASSFFPVVLATAILATPAESQWPPEIKNLQHFPEDKDVRELLQEMRGFAFALGVRCQYCHVGEEGQPITSFDFASDEKNHKKKARVMLEMTAAINADYVSKLGEDGAGLVRVECVTCHRGTTKPEQLNDILVRTVGEESGEAALTRYRELRGEFYGGHTYNFGEDTLVQAAEAVATTGDLASAAALLRENLEHHPQSSWTLGTLAELEKRRGNLDQAREALEKILAFEPDNERVKKTLAGLEAEAKPQ